MSNTNPWKKPVTGAGIAVIVIVCGYWAGISRTDLNQAAGNFEKNRKLAEEQGLYFTTKQVEAAYAIPKNENGAELIKQVLDTPARLKLNQAKPSIKSDLLQNASELEGAIQKIEEASHRKALIFQKDLSNPANMTFPQFVGLKDWVKLLVQMGRYSSEKGDLTNTQRYWRLAAYLGTKADDEGTIIGSLIRIACLAIIEKELQEALSNHGSNPQMVNVIDSVMNVLDQPYDLTRALRMEHWFSVSVMDSIIKNPSAFQTTMGTTATPNEIKYGRFLPRFKTANLSRVHQIYGEGAKALPSDPFDIVGIQTAMSSIDKAGMTPGMSYTMVSFMVPMMSQWGLAVTKEIAQRNVLRQAVALLQPNVDPSKGLPLTGRFAVDVDGKSIRLKKSSDGWVVYSVGMDKVDDGGAKLSIGKGDFAVPIHPRLNQN